MKVLTWPAATSKKRCSGDVETVEALAMWSQMAEEEAGVEASPLITVWDLKNVANFILNGTSSRRELDWIIIEINLEF